MIKEVFIISPTDVYPYVDSVKQLPSKQSQVNARAAVKAYKNSKKDKDEKAIIVLGGNGHSKKTYLEQKKSGLGPILGEIESILIHNYINDLGIDDSSILTELDPSLNTIENAIEAYKLIKSLELAEHYKIRLFAWDLNMKIENSSHAQRADFKYKKSASA